MQSARDNIRARAIYIFPNSEIMQKALAPQKHIGQAVVTNYHDNPVLPASTIRKIFKFKPTSSGHTSISEVNWKIG